MRYIAPKLAYLVTGDGFDYFTDDLADAQRHARERDGIIYVRLDYTYRAATEPRVEGLVSDQQYSDLA